LVGHAASIGDAVSARHRRVRGEAAGDQRVYALRRAQAAGTIDATAVAAVITQAARSVITEAALA
jgi:hypothetical protein